MIALILLIAGIGSGCILGGIRAAEAILAGPGRDFGGAAAEATFTLAIFVPMLMVSLAGARLTLGGKRSRAAPALPALMLGLAIGACGLLIAGGLAGLSRTAIPGAGGFAPRPLLLLGAALTLLQAGAEETLLRGWLQPALARAWPGWLAVPVSALLFMALHLLGGERLPLALVNFFLGGMLFGLLALRTGGLAAPIAAHWAWNCCEGLVLGLDPNPGVGPFGSLFDLDLSGLPVWGGSEQGLNASIAVTLVLVALILPLGVWRPRARVGVGEAEKRL